MLANIFGVRWLIVAAGLALLAGGLVVQTARLKAAQTSETASAEIAAQWRNNFEAMEATNAANVRALEHLQAEAKRISAVAATARDHNMKLEAAYEALRKDLSQAPDDRDLSSLFCRAFDELRRLQGHPDPACRH